MTYVRRLRAVLAFLGVAAVLTSSSVWGEPGKNGSQKKRAERFASSKEDDTFSEDLANSKFAQGGVVAYRTTGDDVLFALQLKPKLPPQAARPCDYLFMVDTSASQAKGPLNSAREIIAATLPTLGERDRVSVWTVNIPDATQDLARGFKAATSPDVQNALARLKQEVPLGDTDLKEGLAKALKSFENGAGRQQVIVFLGDGLSVHNPMSPADRARLADDMKKLHVQFVPVPLGPRLDPANLHGLATGTGGAVVRLRAADKVGETVNSLHESVRTPVLYPKTFTAGGDVAELFPTNLPPLRADAPTLLVGKMKAGQKTIGYTVEGSVNGQDVRIEESVAVGEPEADNFFLVGTFEQWKNAKDQPALTRADRALASAYQQTQLAREDLHARAELALGENKLDVARRLLEDAKKLDPNDVEADAGLKVVDQLRSGKVTKAQLMKQLEHQDRSGLRVIAQAAEKVAPPAQKPTQPAEIAPPVEREDILQEQRRRVAVEEQRVRQIVDDAQRQSRQLLPTDPDAAHDLLKRTYASVRDNPDLGDATRLALLNRLEASLRNADIQGARIKRDRDEQLRLLADARRRFDLEQSRAAEEERTHRRMLQFSNLMAQARYEDAYLQALAIQQDAISSGRGVPPAATAGYDVALAANNLSQIQELRRTREERFLLTLMQVERSHVPFPDEPPIQFPPAAVWREITRLRKDKYESSGFTDDDPVTLRRVREMKEKLAKPVSLDKGIEANTPLRDALEFLSDRYDLTILVDSQAFKEQNMGESIEDKPVRLPKMVGVSLATVLRLLTAQVDGTFLVRRDYIEITTGQRAVTEKVVRVYPVADLVIPIPSAFNTQAVQQQLTILGTGPGLGLQLGSPLALGGLSTLGLGGGALGVGGLGALGLGGVGGLGALGLGGGLGLAGGGLGLAGGGLGLAGGGLGGQIGGAGFNGQPQNLGVGGGQLGFGGGQLGQLGNLGGQFGLQGGDQSSILVELIRQVVGQQREWQRPGVFQRPQPLGPRNPAGGNGEGDSEDVDLLSQELLNSVGYYPPARALVVKGTSRIHTNIGGGLMSGRGGAPGMGALDRVNDGRAFVIKPRSERTRDKLNAAADQQIAAAGTDKKNDKPATKPAADRQLASAKKTDLDPKKVWQNALAKGVNDPGLIIACADFLAGIKAYDHLVEFLRADLRQGIVVRPWVYETLALALESSGGSPAEIERARLSAIDLEPLDAEGYVKASKAMADQKRFDRAVAFCRQASLLEPNIATPFEEALVYAEAAKDPAAMEWAASSLLRHDWPLDNEDLHNKATGKLKNLAELLRRDNRRTDAERMVQATAASQQRDLVIQLLWQGEADLDLEVKEPIGTSCSFMQRQTAGGGTLLGDTLAETTRETYVAAKGFSGDYQVTVRRVWGRPLGGKATIEIIRHQGTPAETRRRETVTFDRSYTLTVSLDDGRRTTAEYVAPPAAQKRPAKDAEEKTISVYDKLRQLANPELVGVETGVHGGLASLGVETAARPVRPPSRGQDGPVVYQTKVSSVAPSSVDLTAQATLLPDQTGIRLRLEPVFQAANRGSSLPSVANPLIPGAPDPGSR